MDKRWFFFSVDVELASYCGTGCRFCPRDAFSRDQGLMSPHVFQTIVQTLAPLKSRMTLCGMGNPLLNPEWAEYVGLYRSAGGACGMVIHVGELTAEVVEQLCKVRPAHLELSFPTLDPEVFYSLCPTTSLQTAKDGADLLINHPDRRFSVTIAGIRTALNPDEEEEFCTYWKQRGVNVRVYTIHSRGGHLADPEIQLEGLITKLNKPCGLFAIHSFIAWNGDVLSCCHDLDGSTVLGNIVSDPLETLMDRMSRRLKNIPHFSICNECDDVYRHAHVPKGPYPRTRKQRMSFLKSWGRSLR